MAVIGSPHHRVEVAGGVPVRKEGYIVPLRFEVPGVSVGVCQDNGSEVLHAPRRRDSRWSCGCRVVPPPHQRTDRPFITVGTRDP
ncbi:MAG: hypothetical protein PHQ81_06795 [Methanofollis sp.]|nr:hypothetical protein [Methanofollis sp.]